MSLWSRLGRIAYWSVWLGSWLYLRGSRRARLLLVCGDEIMVVNNWLGAGKWNLPGGGLHTGEDSKLGLLREVLEETGIPLKPTDLTLLAEEPYHFRGFRYTCIYFTAAVASKPPARRSREITEIAWFARSAISAEAHDIDVRRALELLDSRKPHLIQ